MTKIRPLLQTFFICVVLFSLLNKEQVAASPLSDEGTTLATNVVGNGSLAVSPEQPLYDYGTPVMLTASPEVGWELSNWSGSLEVIPPWWNTYWPYRVALTIEANGVARQEQIAETTIDFTSHFSELGETGAFEDKSIRVVEIDVSGSILDADVPFQFDKDAAYNASTNAVGNLIILMDGKLAASESRLYHIYFAPANNPHFVPSFTQHITSTFTGVIDEGQSAYKFETESATYFYHKDSGGFSSLNDSDGNDWISYDDDISGSGGEFRGIPNLIYRGTVLTGGFHPGLGGSTTTRLNDGPLKASYRTVDGGWETLWEIYPDRVRMTLVEAEHNYWFLYEGTPGGTLDSDDFLVTSDNTQYAFGASWIQDMPNDEWIYFADPNVGDDGRSFFLVNHDGDNITDSYRRLNGPNGAMTVFGFGRENLITGLSGTPQEFTFGLIDETTYADAKPLIEAAYKELTFFQSQPESVTEAGVYDPGASENFTVTMNMNRAITATFVPEYYALETNVVGNGNIELSQPDNSQGYTYGEVVTITAQPDDGWDFDGWSGLSTGITNSLSITLSEDSAITATFLAREYQLNLIQPDTGGAISASPSRATYTYNTPIQLTANTETGYVFNEWLGDLSSSQPVETINITDNMTVTALFEIASYGVEAAVVGQGQIELSPLQAVYSHGSIIDVTALPQEGWLFSNWGGGLTGNSPNESLTIVEAETITATFVPKQFSLTANTVGAGSITLTPQQDTYAYGSSVTLSATPAKHWAFIDWSGVAVTGAPTTTLTVSEDHVFTATFAPRKYTLTTLTQGNGSVKVEPNKASYLAGETVQLTAEPVAGWILSRWEGDLSGSAISTSVEITGDMEIRALFEEANVEIETAAIGDGQVLIQPQRTLYEQGTEVTLIATAEPGWRFVSWNDNDGSPAKQVEVRSGDVYTATFAKEIYTISVNVVGNGNIERTPSDPLTYGDKVTLNAVPDPGWFFAGWQGALSGTDSSGDLTIVGDTSVTATFTTSPYTVIANVNGRGGVLFDPIRQSYSLNERVTLKAVAEPGWTFSGWSGDITGKNPSTQLTITRNHAVTASFVEGTESQNIYLPLISNFR